jgi:hypothetical protein
MTINRRNEKLTASQLWSDCINSMTGDWIYDEKKMRSYYTEEQDHTLTIYVPDLSLVKLYSGMFADVVRLIVFELSKCQIEDVQFKWVDDSFISKTTYASQKHKEERLKSNENLNNLSVTNRLYRQLILKEKLTKLEQQCLVQDEDVEIRFLLLKNYGSNLDITILKVLANDVCYKIRFQLSNVVGLSTEILKILAQDETAEVRYSLLPDLYDTKINLVVQRILVDDINYEIREKLTQNYKLTQGVQLTLAHSENATIRQLITFYGSDKSVQTLLANDTCENVRAFLASHQPNLNRVAQKILACDVV